MHCMKSSMHVGHYYTEIQVRARKMNSQSSHQVLAHLDAVYKQVSHWKGNTWMTRIRMHESVSTCVLHHPGNSPCTLEELFGSPLLPKAWSSLGMRITVTNTCSCVAKALSNQDNVRSQNQTHKNSVFINQSSGTFFSRAYVFLDAGENTKQLWKTVLGKRLGKGGDLKFYKNSHWIQR